MFALEHDTKVTLGISAFVCALVVGGILLNTNTYHKVFQDVTGLPCVEKL